MIQEPSSSAISKAMPRRSEQAVQDAALVERIASGDSDALSDLYDQYAGLLKALSRRVLYNEAAAEEVLQEVFLQVWKQAERYDFRRSSVSTWLSLITRSRSIDRLRSRQVKERTVDDLKKEIFETHTSPEGPRAVWMGERRERLRQALNLLPEEQRQVVELAFFEGKTQREISNETETPLGTVKTRTLLAMKKLRKALESDLGELL